MKKVCSIVLVIIIFFIRPLYVKAEEVDKVSTKNNKIVFLTFDDGPSLTNTPKVLEILNRYNVKATFFVIGAKVEEYPNEAKMMVKNGMAVFPHCYIHDYNKIYKSDEAYIKDLKRCQKTIEDILGRTNKSFVRFPGGSVNDWVNKSTFENIKKRLAYEGISYVDWNVSAEDALAYRLSCKKIENNVLKGYKGCSVAVILMHDSETKVTTVQSLPTIIEALKADGYEFKTFDDVSREEFNRMIRLNIINR